MFIVFFQPKIYLYAKNKVKYIFPVLAIFFFTACTSPKGKGGMNIPGERAIPYDMPPTAPVPPEKYCFEMHDGTDNSKMELTIEGDSAYGKIDYAKTTNLTSGEFKGVIYGNTLLVSYQFKTDNGIKREDQKWKLEKGNIYKVNEVIIPDSLQSKADSLKKIPLKVVLAKVPCK